MNMSWCSLILVWVVLMHHGTLTPTPLDDLTVNLNLNDATNGGHTFVSPEIKSEEWKTGKTTSKETCTAAWLQKNQGFQSKFNKKSKRILGGTDVLNWEKWPWTASLKISGYHNIKKCGGVLISCNHIVTARHCLYDYMPNGKVNRPKGLLPPNNVSISLGSTKYMRGIAKFKGKVIYYKNTGFKEESDIPNDDIAVIEMTGGIKPPTEIHPILLPNRTVGTIEDSDLNKRSSNFWVTGWGGTPAETDRLKETNQLKLRPGKICNKREKLDFNDKSEICIERFGPKDLTKAATCFGDSGGPGMMKYTSNRKWHLQAVVSYNDNPDCTKPGLSGMANVFYYKKDIEEIIQGVKPKGWARQTED